MKKASATFYKTSNTIIVGLLALLGFTSSCNKDPMAEYGTPSAKFIINGKVNSKDADTPIENIRVVVNSDTSFTDSNGNYQVIKIDFPSSKTFQMKFQDIDSTINDEYQNLDTIVEFVDPQFVNGDGSWYKGEVSKEFDVKLAKK